MAEIQCIIHEMADIRSAMVSLHDGRLGGVARGIGGTLVSPPLDMSDVRQYFEDDENVPGTEKQAERVAEGAPAPTSESG